MDWDCQNSTIKRDNVGDYANTLCEDCEPSEKLPLTGNEAGASNIPHAFRWHEDRAPTVLQAKSQCNPFCRAKQFHGAEYLSNGWFRAKRHLASVNKHIADSRRPTGFSS